MRTFRSLIIFAGLDVAIPDIRGTYAQIYLYSLRPDLSVAGQTTVPAGLGTGSRTSSRSRQTAASTSRSTIAATANQLVDLIYATSSDGGQTWRTARVTPQGFDPST